MHNLALFFLMRPRPPSSTLFPYTTLFRSREVLLNEGARFLLGDAQLAGERERSLPVDGAEVDRKSTRLNSSHRCISYAVFCLKKKNTSVAGTDYVRDRDREVTHQQQRPKT